MIVSDILLDSSYFSWKKNVELFGSFDKQYIIIFFIIRGLTSSSAIAQRNAAGWVSFGQKWKTGMGGNILRTL